MEERQLAVLQKLAHVFFFQEKFILAVPRKVKAGPASPYIDYCVSWKAV